MKVLLVADKEERSIWNHWESTGKKRLEGVQLVLSAGDIRPEYLEFLVTMLNVPCLYIRGNHDGIYDSRPPEGCLNIDCRIAEFSSGDQTVRIAGLGGSIRYRGGSDMYSEGEMRRRVRSLRRQAVMGVAYGSDGKRHYSSDLALSARQNGRPAVDLFLTHAPCLGHGDMDDLPHRGFECFNHFNYTVRPDYHCYGHVHPEYNALMRRESAHPSGTRLINVSGIYLLDL